MKKQIVISLCDDHNGWKAEIYGRVDDKETKSIVGWFADKALAISCISCESNMTKIEKWMEQIG